MYPNNLLVTTTKQRLYPTMGCICTTCQPFTHNHHLAIRVPYQANNLLVTTTKERHYPTMCCMYLQLPTIYSQPPPRNKGTQPRYVGNMYPNNLLVTTNKQRHCPTRGCMYHLPTMYSQPPPSNMGIPFLAKWGICILTTFKSQPTNNGTAQPGAVCTTCQPFTHNHHLAIRVPNPATWGICILTTF
jgi:hypothetical protein